MAKPPNRRKVVAGIAGAAVVGGVLAVRRSYGFFDWISGKSNGIAPGEDGKVRLPLDDDRYKKLTKVGESLKVDIKGMTRPLIVMRTGEESASALSSRCPHQDCEVKLPREGEIQCPCHRSRFELDGTVKEGPAKSDLQSYPAELSDDAVLITV